MRSLWLVLSVVGFAVLAAFCGVGVFWMAVATIANHMTKGHGDEFVANSVPLLATGGVVGFIVGLVGRIIWLRRKRDT